MFNRKTFFFLITFLTTLTSCSEEKTLPTDSHRQAISDSASTAKPQPARADTTLADQYFARAKQFEKETKYDSAIVYLQQAVPQFETQENWEKLARTYNALANMYRTVRQLQPAFETAQKALNLGLEKLGGAHVIVAESRQSLGIVYAIMGQLDKALEEFTSAAQIFEKTLGENDLKVGFSHNNLGNLKIMLGDLDAALEHYEKSLQVKRQVLGENDPNVAEAYFALGQGYRNKGDLEKSLVFSQKALDGYLATIGERQPRVARLYTSFGNAYAEMTDYDQALLYFQKALDVMTAIFGEKHEEVAGLITNIGGVYYLSGDHQQALANMQKAEKLYIDVLGENHPSVANNFLGVGDVYFDLGEYELASENFNRGLHGFTNALGGQHIEVANSKMRIGNVLRAQKKYTKAIETYQETIAHYKNNIGDRYFKLAECYNNLAQAYGEMGRYYQALEAYNDAILANARGEENALMAETVGSEDVLTARVLIETISGMAAIFEKKAGGTAGEIQDLEKSVLYYGRTAKILEETRRNFKAEGSKFDLSAKAVEVYEKGLQTSIRLHRATSKFSNLALAFDFAEKSRAGVLVEALDESRAKKFAGIPDSLLEKEKRLRIDLAFYERTISEERGKGAQADSGKIVRWQNQLFANKRDYDALIRRFENEFPEYYALKYDAQIASLKEIQNGLLDPQTALIEYFAGNDSIYILSVTQSDFSVEVIAKRRDLAQQINDFRETILTKTLSDYPNQAYALYEMLLASTVERLNVQNLIIIPDAALSALPFEALLSKPAEIAGGAKAFQSLEYVIKDFSISYAYSATLLLQTRLHEQPDFSKDYLAYAPVFSGGLPAGSRGEKFLSGNLGGETIRSSNRVFGYLPASKIEVNRIFEIFSKRYGFLEKWLGDKSMIALENNANEARLKSTPLADYRYLHFATHGFVNNDDPKLSGLVLSQDSTLADDGILHLSEIYNLDVNADLVVLSACETGLGQIAKGEGIIGMTRGFLYAGARNLLVSLWQVNDQTTADLMVDFYTEMLEDGGKVKALRRAKLALISNNPEYAKPFYWAPFILIGK